MASERSALPSSMAGGKASYRKPALGDKPVFAYIASLPEPQRSIAQRFDALAAEALPNLQRSIKWGISWYGVGDGWSFSCGGFADHVKVMFGRGTSLVPVPPVTPVAMGKETRGVEIQSVDEIDEAQLVSWIEQAAALPVSASAEPGQHRGSPAPEPQLRSTFSSGRPCASSSTSLSR